MKTIGKLIDAVCDVRDTLALKTENCKGAGDSFTDSELESLRCLRAALWETLAKVGDALEDGAVLQSRCREVADAMERACDALDSEEWAAKISWLRIRIRRLRDTADTLDELRAGFMVGADVAGMAGAEQGGNA